MIPPPSAGSRATKVRPRPPLPAEPARPPREPAPGDGHSGRSGSDPAPGCPPHRPTRPQVDDPALVHILTDPARLATLRGYDILDTEPEPAFDDFAQLAASACGRPMALIGFVDEVRRSIKAQVGLPAGSALAESTLCRQVVVTGRPVVIRDLTEAPCGDGPPPVLDGRPLRFYAGVPLISPDRHAVGVLAVLDVEPGELEATQLDLLQRLARQVVDRMELRARTRELEFDRQMLGYTGEVLGMITTGAGLGEVLDTVARAVERCDPDVLCSILLVDGPMLRDGAGPSLPPAYREAIDGLRYGANVGSCGTAAYTRRRVVTPDISTDPKWEPFRELAALAGVRACWSSPILGPGGEVLGTFAQYFRHPRMPEPRHWQLIQRWTDLTGLAITRTRAQEQIRRMAMTDPLTELPNRTGLFAGYLSAMQSGPAAGHTALLLMDLDRFKVVNDSLGHAIGDRYLATVGARLAEAVGASGIVSRFGGDEFVVLATGLAEPEDAERLGRRLVDVVREPVTVDDRQIVLSASVGVALADAPTTTATALLRNADSALYRAKALGRDRVTVFDTAMHEQAVARMELEADLRAALLQDEQVDHQLSLAYQATLDLATGEVDGVEALCRWRHPTRGDVSPGEFIPVAEDSGLIVPLGRWVLRTALAEHARRRARDPEWQRVTLWVNVSVVQLNADLVAVVAQTLGETGVPPQRLGLEVTESSLMADLPTARSVLLALHALGIQLAIDDFGTGYSNLSQLKLLPLDELKIDRSFVAGIGMDRIDDGVVQAVVALARAHGLRVVAEGVETPGQRDHLSRLGCDAAQGFLYGRPGMLDAIRIPAGPDQ